MRSNVGGLDRVARSVLGPALVLAGWRTLDNRRLLAVAALVGGAVITETAVTATCPVNRALGMDSRAGRQRAALREMAHSGLDVTADHHGSYDASGAGLSGLALRHQPTPEATEPATRLGGLSREAD